MKERWTYIPVEKEIRDALKEKKGMLTYTEYFTFLMRIEKEYLKQRLDQIN